MQRPNRGSVGGVARFAPVALGLTFGLSYVLTLPRNLRDSSLWVVLASLLVALTTTAGAVFTYGLDRWAELAKLLQGHTVRVRDVAARVATIVTVSLLVVVGSTRTPGAAHTPWRGVALITVALLGGVPAGGVMEGIRHAADNAPLSDTGGEEVAMLIRLRQLLQRLLAAVGAVVALWTLVNGAGAALARSLPAGSGHGGVTQVFPQVVVVLGAGASLVVALFYVPAATALQRRGQGLCDELFPLDDAKQASAILSLAEDRHKLEQLLGVDRGVIADLQTGLVILGPLLVSAAAAFLSP